MNDNNFKGIENILNWLKLAGVKQEGSKEQFVLWLNLMQEELMETVYAREANNRDEQVDGLGDLIWVVCNWAHMNNLPLIDTLKKIEASNYSKFCDTEEQAIETCESYKEGTHWDKKDVIVNAYYIKEGDKYIIKRKEDDKILKSLYYVPVKDVVL